MSKFWRHMQVTLLISARQMLQPVARNSEAKWTSLRSHWERLMPSSSGCDNFFDFTPQRLLGPAFYHHKTNWLVEETSALWESTNWESPFIFKHLLIVSLRSVIHVVTSEKRNIKAVRLLLLFFFPDCPKCNLNSSCEGVPWRFGFQIILNMKRFLPRLFLFRLCCMNIIISRSQQVLQWRKRYQLW